MRRALVSFITFSICALSVRASAPTLLSYVAGATPLAAQAKDYLGKIAGGRAEEGKFQQGVQAYNANDFGRAKDLLGGISAGHAAEARGYSAGWSCGPGSCPNSGRRVSGWPWAACWRGKPIVRA